MMHRWNAWWATLALALSGIQLAAAADLPPAAPLYKAPPAIASYSWTGFYVGANAGYGWGDPKGTMAGDVPGGAGSGLVDSVFIPFVDTISDNTFPLSNKIAGVFGGLQFGYNWQTLSRWLTGIETDFQFSGVRGNSNVAAPPGPGAIFAFSSHQNLDWFGTLRGRLGYLLTDRFLLFATGGLAYGETKANASIAVSGLGIIFPPGFPTTLTCLAPSVCLADSQSRVSAGWAAGGGIEYAVWQNVTFKIEYLHVGLGSQNLTLVVQPPATGNAFALAHFNYALDTVRGGVNYRF